MQKSLKTVKTENDDTADTESKHGVEIEGKFYKKPFGIFGAKEDAIQWMNEEIIKAIEKE